MKCKMVLTMDREKMCMKVEHRFIFLKIVEIMKF